MGPSSADGWERWALESLLTALLLPLFLAAHFLHQAKSDCHFFNGTQRVWFLYRFFPDREEIVRFDSDVGEFVAVTPLGQRSADQWKNCQDHLQYERAAVDRFCREACRVASYGADKAQRVIGRRINLSGSGTAKLLCLTPNLVAGPGPKLLSPWLGDHQQNPRATGGPWELKSIRETFPEGEFEILTCRNYALAPDRALQQKRETETTSNSPSPPGIPAGTDKPPPTSYRGHLEGVTALRAHFLHQEKSDCHFLNGRQRVHYLYRDIYDRQEIVHFESNIGRFVAVTPLGQLDADYWNSRPEAKPTVTISPAKTDPGSPNTILLCTATGFYPLEIDVQWLKNGWLEKEGVAFGEELQDGDWTYQLQVLLETQTQRGDIYACKVGHASLEAPLTVQWEPRSSNAAKSKLWTGAVGAVLGVVFLAVGLSLYLKNKKATPIQQPGERLLFTLH
ncbi:HLA class II histocompatibility antigen, DRB1-1 beta chain-like [Python bivittatus]|uniref:HLA class II histocompatibility antigen, DRB1-1 beta chain-like n=1 Tax=Python bivittatus TaxID=176946 RepID=A0A9F5N237_PYTBI|nr:HLA class II histocompatibility antigen, DRB1-1 beta chain-like [Python bivittatus]